MALGGYRYIICPTRRITVIYPDNVGIPGKLQGSSAVMETNGKFSPILSPYVLSGVRTEMLNGGEVQERHVAGESA